MLKMGSKCWSSKQTPEILIAICLNVLCESCAYLKWL